MITFTSTMTAFETAYPGSMCRYSDGDYVMRNDPDSLVAAIIEGVKNRDKQIENLQDAKAVQSSEIDRLTQLLTWAYGKLHHVSFSKLEDNLKLDEIKLLLEHGL
jgi:hypothetical protein